MGRFFSSPWFIALVFLILLGLFLVLGFLMGWSAKVLIILGFSILFVWVLVMFLRELIAGRRASKLEKALKSQAEPAIEGSNLSESRKEEIRELQQTFNAAIDTLKRSSFGKGGRRGQKALYALPWYLMVGPPGAGKTTFIENSGLEFPLGSDRVRGIGGTRNCDWFFTNEAILLDTAGRYMTEEDDREEWNAFLDILKKNRRRKPVNGVIVGIDLGDMLNFSNEELIWHADNMRRRMNELIVELGVRFPVYLVFTKTDLVSGFVPFFETLNVEERAQVWGATLDMGSNLDPGTQFETEFELLLERLRQARLKRLSDPLKSEIRRHVYFFPEQLALLEKSLSLFVGRLFQRNLYQETPIFRGFYFTSGTQEGTPIDRIIEAISDRLNLPHVIPSEVVPESSPKAYFIRDVIREVIIPDQNLAGATSRMSRLRTAVQLAVLALTVLVVGSGLWYSWSGYQSGRAAVEDVGEAADNLSFNQLSIREPASFQALERLRTSIDDLKEIEAEPFVGWWGFKPDQNVTTTAEQLYFGKMENLFQQDVQRTLEGRLRENIQGAGTEVQYRNYLRAYLLLGSEFPRLQEDAEQRFLIREITGLIDIPQGSTPGLQALLEKQVTQAVQYVGAEQFPVVTNQQAIVQRARQQLRTPTVETVYEIMKQGFRNQAEPLTLERILNGRTDGMSCTGFCQIPGLFTKQAWESYFKDATDSPSLGSQVDWVTGITLEDLPPTLRDPEQLSEALQTRYFQEYIRTWDDFLKAIDHTSFQGHLEGVRRLQRLSDLQDSPLVKILARVAEETTFEDENLLEDLGEAAGSRAGRRVLGRTGSRAAGQAQRLGEDGAMHPVQYAFDPVHQLFLEDGFPSETLSSIMSEYTLIASEMEGWSDPRAARDYAVGMVTGNASLKLAQRNILTGTQRLDPALRESLFEAPLGQAWDVVLGQTQAYLSSQWRDRVYRVYQETLQPYFPFDRNSTVDASPVDVTAFFDGSSGVLWAFFEEELAPFIDRTNFRAKQTWMNRGIGVSSATQRALTQADQISKSLLRTGALQSSFRLRPDKPSPDGVLEQICIDIDGLEDCYGIGSPRWIDVEWPGATPRALLEIHPVNGAMQTIQYEGEWAWFRLLQHATRIRARTPRNFDVQWTFDLNSRSQVVVYYQLEARSSDNPYRDLQNLFKVPFSSNL